MDKKQLTQLAGTFTSSCKETVRRGKVQVYASPVLATTLILLQSIGSDPLKFPPKGWLG